MVERARVGLVSTATARSTTATAPAKRDSRVERTAGTCARPPRQAVTRPSKVGDASTGENWRARLVLSQRHSYCPMGKIGRTCHKSTTSSWEGPAPSAGERWCRGDGRKGRTRTRPITRTRATCDQVAACRVGRGARSAGAPRGASWIRRGAGDRGLRRAGWCAHIHSDHRVGPRPAGGGAGSTRAAAGGAERVDDRPHLARRRRRSGLSCASAQGLGQVDPGEAPEPR